MVVQESFGAVPIVANGNALTQAKGSMGGFCCAVAGTLTITRTADSATILAATPVSAGVFLPLPFVFSESWTITLSGGAAGTLAVN